MKKQEISDEAKAATIGRSEFDAALADLLKAPPASKETVSRKINSGKKSIRRPVLKSPDSR